MHLIKKLFVYLHETIKYIVMEKIELKHLVGYLPYGLKGALSTDCQEDFAELIELVEDEVIFKKNTVWKYSGYADSNLCVPLGEGELDGFLMSNENTYACFSGVCKVLPILRPLSDLTKDEINAFSVDVRLALRECNSEKLLNRACYHEIEWLLERHFDIHGLIKNNLAIDFNTLNI